MLTRLSLSCKISAMNTTCDCGCGLLAKPGKRFHKYHNLSADGRALRWDAKRGKYEYNYRLVMEFMIGRKLEPGECVHHKNGNPNDDHPDNLVLCSSLSEHLSEHHSKNKLMSECLICGKVYHNVRRGKYPACSPECRAKVSYLGRGIVTGAGATVTFACKTCGKTVTKKGNRGGFCSTPCRGKWSRGNIRPENAASRLLTYNGETLPAAHWAKRLGVEYRSFMNRLYMGWSVERTITQPFQSKSCQFTKPPRMPIDCGTLVVVFVAWCCTAPMSG